MKCLFFLTSFLLLAFLSDGQLESLKHFVEIKDAMNTWSYIPMTPMSFSPRLKRQIEMTYVYRNVYNQEESISSGPWGEWTRDGPCSRNCGGGVLRESRICNASPGSDPYICKGPDKRFSTCNANVCSEETRDFREEQCSEFDSIPFEQKLYSWIPYTKAPRKCELNCMPRGERFYYRHAKKVIDGTLCDMVEGVRRICVDGDCQEVGCDGILGSKEREDKCRLCGGDGSNCNTITGILANQDMTMGYNDLLLLPMGATNIRISEMKSSNNYLALRNTTGHYFINGNWHIDFPDEYDVAGSKFIYEKKSKKGKTKGIWTLFAPEVLRSLGPINQPIYISMLYQEENPGIEFEYSIPKGVVKETKETDSYNWMTSNWEECSLHCGGGSQRRSVFCAHSSTLEQVAETLCELRLKPLDKESCNDVPCEPVWQVGPWSNCTEKEIGNLTVKDCFGVSHRNVYCSKVVSSTSVDIVNDSVCVEEKPLAIQSCDEIDAIANPNVSSTEPIYFVGPWSGCSALCGNGIKTRDVICHKVEKGIKISLEDSECKEKKPDIEENCEANKSCSPTDWITSEWSTCDDSCGLTSSSRHALCSDNEGVGVNATECTREEPTLIKNCTNVVIKGNCEYSWFAMQWSLCSSKCEEILGIQTRFVFCGQMTTNTTELKVQEDETLCDASLKYEATQNCEGTENCTGLWYTGEWSTCSQKCSPGQRSRSVYCIIKNQPVSPESCDSESIPSSNEPCNEDKECSGDDDDDNSDDEKKDCEFYPDEWIWGLEDGSGEEESSSESSVSNESSNSEDLMSLFKKRCKPPVKDDCYNSTFGCCADEFHEAKGPFEAGCSVIKTCEDTQFGCCLDWITPALGRQFKDCPSLNCENTLFGCCSDGETIANGPEYEGCENKKKCSFGKYGCCPDQMTFKQGPQNQGCFECSKDVWNCDSCEKTEFGCCVDLENAASGPNFEGCEEGSGEEDYMDCTLSEHGCCPDGLTKARGTAFKGCENATPCKTNRWGCCEDLLYPAHGPNKEGCCLSSKFGCCPDYITPAKGLDHEGCGCEFTEFKCCPDDVTAARGADFEGCGCQTTEFGCCPDNFTPALGEFFAGCPCHTHEYGCCPNGESIARGPGQQGCSCKDTEFGCCPDRKTPSSGPNSTDCDCAASLFGCCPDGVKEAQGINFEDCDSVLPVPLSDVCGLLKDRGEDRNFTMKWYFDIEYGGCSKFWYGGGKGNQNKFEDKETCEAVCVEPEGEAACSLPIVLGPCEGHYPRFGYNTNSKTCEKFIYGGCLGNKNRFESRDECESICSEDPAGVKNIDKCKQPIKRGPCEGNFTRFAFSSQTMECQEFTYGGCKGNANSFFSSEECENSCGSERSNRQMCLLPRSPGPCKDQLPKWYFDNFEKRCIPFYYGGCEGNGNRFDDQSSCQSSCPSEFLQADICTLQEDSGPCSDYLERYYFDASAGICRPFYYGGCKGNKNNFQSLNECQSRCSVDFSIPIEEEFKLEFCFTGKDVGNGNESQSRWYYDFKTGVCEGFLYSGKKGNGNRFLTRQSCEIHCVPSQNVCDLPKVVGPCNGRLENYWFDKTKQSCFTFDWSGCQGNGNRFETKEFCEASCRGGSQLTESSKTSSPVNICNLPEDAGPCSEKESNWYYNSKTFECTSFIYGGCEGNANRFRSQEQCDRHCGLFRDQDVCSLNTDIGPCLGRFKKWTFDKGLRICKEFTFGGCEGNGNRFSSPEECETVCVVQDEPASLTGNITELSRSAICELEVENGPCTDIIQRWYFDPSRASCFPFIYSGCAGNRNRFKSFEICIGFCNALMSVSRPFDQLTSETPLSYLTSTLAPSSTEENVCLDSNKRCENIHCPYGILKYIDDRSKCNECYCNEPCKGYECEPTAKCAVEIYKEAETTAFRAVCREENKDGICPKLSRNNEYSSCSEDCNSDSDCGANKKCCYNGCGKSCLSPVNEPGSEYLPNVSEENLPESDPNAAVIQSRQNTVIANEGTIAVLYVDVSGDPKPDVYWRIGRKDIESRYGKYRILKDGSLQIIGVEYTDEGVYTCLADNGRGIPAEATITLGVDVPIELTAQILSYEPEVMSLGAPASLLCLAYGYPKPTVTWWRNSIMLPLSSKRHEQSSDYSLLIRTLSLADLGYYTCQAFNGIGQAASETLLLTALGPIYGTDLNDEPYLKYVINAPDAPIMTEPSGYRPSRGPNWDWSASPTTTPRTTTPRNEEPLSTFIEVRINTARTRYLTNSRIDISCIVNSYTKPRVFWYKDNNRLLPSQKREMSSGLLTIFESNENDSGTYTCEGVNDVRSESKSVTIIVENNSTSTSTCTDNPYYANCKLIVKANYCGNKYYAKFCCRSCQLSGQIVF